MFLDFTRRQKMSIFYPLGRCCAILVLVVALSPVAMANAAGREPPALVNHAYGIDCTASICTVSLAGAGAQLPGIARVGATYLLETVRQNIRILPDNAGLTLSNDLILRLPVGNFPLLEANVTAEMAPDGTVLRLRGAGRVPLRAFGVELFAEMGIDQGRNLHTLNPLLAPDHRYLFLQMGDGRPMPAGGQRLTIIANLSEPFFQVDGTLRVSGPALAALVMPDILGLYNFSPLNSSLDMQLRGQIAPRVDDSYLQIDSRVTLLPALLARWFDDDAQPVAAAGSLRFDGAGVLFRTTANARIMPDVLLKSNMEVEAFVPFSRQFWQSYLAVGGNASLPLVKTELAASGRLEAAALTTLFDGTLWTQLASEPPTLFLMVKDGASGVVQVAAQGVASSGVAAVNGYEWIAKGVSRGAEATGSGISSGYHSAKELAGGSYRWVADTVVTGATDAAWSGYQSASQATTCSLTRAQILWCTTTGLCEAPVACTHPATP
jgi:hypothetical protein